MRHLLRLSLPLFALFAVIFSTGCGDDTPGLPGGVVLPPVISIDPAQGFISADTELDLDTPSFSVRVTGNDGDADLQSLRIEENGVAIPASRLTISGFTTANNPQLIPPADAGGFTYDVIIADYLGGTGSVTYNFMLTDTDGESDSESFTINYVQTGPMIELLVADGFVSGDATVNSFGGIFSVRLRSTPTVANVSEIAVLENGTLLDTEQVVFNPNGSSPIVANPLAFGGNGNDVAVTDEILIRPDGTTNDTRTYTFRVTDVDGVVSTRDVVITFDTPPGTPITFDTSGIFFNAAGSMNGGLDLDNGTAVGFRSDDADIKDEGIDERIATGTENWRAQISGANDATVRLVDLATLGDGVTYESVGTQEMIRMAYDNGSVLDGDDSFDQIPDIEGEEVSQQINGGEIFAVLRDDRYYLVRFDEVNYAADSNSDNYSVSIRY